jgi:Transposase DDE domain
LKTSGGVWHQKHKETGEIPHPSIDTEAGWSKSGWHGWWYGWKLHLAVSVGSVWIPLAAELTPANTADNTIAPQLLAPLPAAVRYILGDTHYNDPEVRTLCEQTDRALVATRRGAYPHHDEQLPGNLSRKDFVPIRGSARGVTWDYFYIFVVFYSGDSPHADPQTALCR